MNKSVEERAGFLLDSLCNKTVKQQRHRCEACVDVISKEIKSAEKRGYMRAIRNARNKQTQGKKTV